MIFIIDILYYTISIPSIRPKNVLSVKHHLIQNKMQNAENIFFIYKVSDIINLCVLLSKSDKNCSDSDEMFCCYYRMTGVSRTVSETRTGRTGLPGISCCICCISCWAAIMLCACVLGLKENERSINFMKSSCLFVCHFFIRLSFLSSWSWLTLHFNQKMHLRNFAAKFISMILCLNF